LPLLRERGGDRLEARVHQLADPGAELVRQHVDGPDEPICRGSFRIRMALAATAPPKPRVLAPP
jgi:hypothetical protein